MNIEEFLKFTKEDTRDKFYSLEQKIVELAVDGELVPKDLIEGYKKEEMKKLALCKLHLKLYHEMRTSGGVIRQDAEQATGKVIYDFLDKINLFTTDMMANVSKEGVEIITQKNIATYKALISAIDYLINIRWEWYDDVVPF